MAPSGTVVLIDGPTGVEQLADELRQDITAGRLRPNEELSLSLLAERHGVRLRSLQVVLTGLENDGLLTVRGTTAIVTPLDRAELSSVLRARRALEAEMAARSGELMAAAQFDRLVAGLPARCCGLDREGDSVYSAIGGFFLDLCRPAATVWELHMLREAWRHSQRYMRIGAQAVCDAAPDAATASRAIAAGTRQFGEQIAECGRAGDGRGIKEQVLQMIERASLIAEHGLASSA